MSLAVCEDVELLYQRRHLETRDVFSGRHTCGQLHGGAYRFTVGCASAIAKSVSGTETEARGCNVMHKPETSPRQARDKRKHGGETERENC
ncbi:hypothetical protein SKAU_G00040740 [Synaphobranchus kaupii]|uniref:Uncharacterized protein n=1 Tax=Synaphobranchus kaupii TaxID=118154 RepID=A0A9Q1G223_SYNKA|nr:hypothetical protein SKAU_G00040740 [Synaphobranchus kaupii]